jgi:hypothetical protein
MTTAFSLVQVMIYKPVARLIDPSLFTPYPPSYFPGPVLVVIAQQQFYPDLVSQGHLKL